MKNSGNEILYIGKATNLRNRLRSYFSHGEDTRFQIPFLLKKVCSIAWIVTTNEMEALILEANLIRKHKPPYNIDLKDDKHYPYLKITVNEPFPRIYFVRRVVPDKAVYFGPYTDSGTVRRVMEFAKKIFKIRNCRYKLPSHAPKRPCINYEIKRCSGPCAGFISQENYNDSISLLISFLKGKQKDVISLLESRMHTASKAQAYENAAQIRDQIQLMQRASYLQKVDLRTPDKDCDVYGFHQSDYNLCLCILSFKGGLLFLNRSFLLDLEQWEASEFDREALILQYYQKYSIELPHEIILPQNTGFTSELLYSYFKNQYNRSIDIVIPQRGQKRDLVFLAEKNARLYSVQNSQFDPHRLLQNCARSLKLPRIPSSIEAFDISNYGESNAVAGMVHFADGKPDKSLYRRFKIKTVQGQNDFAMLQEAVTRRLTRLEKEKKSFPDLLLIDGGKGQLSSVKKILSSFSDPPMLISIAKKDEILYSEFCTDPVILSRSDPVQLLLQRIRDEVHRWVITYHRTKRDKHFKRSSLETVPGIGKKKAQILLRHFGSLKKIQNSSVQDIAAVEGFSLQTAEFVLKHITKAQ